MKKVLIMIALFSIGMFTISCSDAKRGKLFAWGNSAKVTCFSGGIEIYNGYSTGKVISEENSDGYFFVDKASKRTMEVSGNCIIVYK